jgi:hypothetical protein
MNVTKTLRITAEKSSSVRCASAGTTGPTFAKNTSSKQHHYFVHAVTTAFPNWQKELWQTFEETSGYVRLERVKKAAQLHDRYMMMMMLLQEV